MLRRCIEWQLNQAQIQALQSWADQERVETFGYFDGNEYQALWKKGQSIPQQMQLSILSDLAVVPLVCWEDFSCSVGCLGEWEITPELFLELKDISLGKYYLYAGFEFSDIGCISALAKVDWERVLNMGDCTSLTPLNLSLCYLKTKSGGIETVGALTCLKKFSLGMTVDSTARLKTFLHRKEMFSGSMPGHLMRLNRSIARHSGVLEPLKDMDALVGLTQLTELNISSCESLTSVDALAGMTQLRKLDLSFCESLMHVDALASLTQLSKLNLRYCKSLTNLNFLAGLARLTELDLEGCISLQTVDFRAALPRLSKLNFSFCKNLTDVDALVGLAKLVELDLRFCTALRNVDVLAGLTHLTKLDLSSCESLTNVDALAGLTQLSKLDLGSCEFLTSVDALAGLKQLTELNLGFCKSLTDVDVLVGLTQLADLDLSHCTSLTNVDCLAGLTQLSKLDLSSCEFLTNMDVLAGLTQLTDLNLSHCTSLTNVDALAGLTQLTKLNLWDCGSPLFNRGSLTNVDALAGLKQLTELNLSSCEFLTNVNVLAGLTQLTDLDLSHCTSLTNVDALAGLTQLTKLNLSSCTSLTNVDALAGLKQLTELNLNSCESLTNVDALGSLTRLASVDLGYCDSLTNVDALASLPQLEKLDLRGSNYIQNYEPLYNCIALEKLKLDRDDVAKIILTHCAWERQDESYWGEFQEEIEDFLKISLPMPLRHDVLAGIAKGAVLLEEGDRIKLLDRLIEDCKQNDFNQAVLAACLHHLPSLSDQSQAEDILESALKDGPACGEDAWEVRINTILAVLPAFPSAVKDWALDVARQVLEPLEERPDRLAKVASAVLTFFAKMEMEDELAQWLEQVTALEGSPEAVDTGFSMSASYHLHEECTDEASACPSRGEAGSSLNVLAELLPHRDGEEDVWRDVLDELVENKIVRQAKRECLLESLAGEKHVRWQPVLREAALRFLASEGMLAADDLEELLEEGA